MGLSLAKTLGKGEREEAPVVGESRYDPARIINGENRKRVEHENQNCSMTATSGPDEKSQVNGEKLLSGRSQDRVIAQRWCLLKQVRVRSSCWNHAHPDQTNRRGLQT